MWPNYSQVVSVPLSTIPWYLLRTAAESRRHKELFLMLLAPWLRKRGLLVHNESTVICGFIFVCRFVFYTELSFKIMDRRPGFKSSL